MSLRFQQVALIGKHPTAQGGTPPAVLHGIAQTLQAEGCTVTLDELTAEISGVKDWPYESLAGIGKKCDLAVVVGGDGTMLAAARTLAHDGIPLIGINQGRLGFITDIALDDYASTLQAMLHGDYVEHQRSLIDAQVERAGEIIMEATAMNDVVVNRGSSAGLVELRVEIDGHFVANHRADGLIVATPTGSTAYALSAGGPILHPGMGGFVMVPISPHNLSNRPIALPDSVHITIEIVAAKEVTANFDMQSIKHLQPGDRILIQRAKKSARMLHPRGWSYFDTLRHKLHWNEHN